MKSENINRFKEVVFLTAFLVLLFSFSNRALTKTQGSEKKRDLSYSLYKADAVTSAQQIGVKENSSQEHLTFGNFKNSSLEILGAKLDSHICYVLKNNPLIKMPGISRFYYHFFSLKNEEDPA